MSIELSTRLKQAREALGLSLDEIQAKTRIPIQYLYRIESGQWTESSPAYIRTYIRHYEKFIGEHTPVRSFTRERSSLSGVTTTSSRAPLDLISIPTSPKRMNTFSSAKKEEELKRTVYKTRRESTASREVLQLGKVGNSFSETRARRISLPQNLPHPKELGLFEKEKAQNIEPTPVPSRRSRHMTDAKKKKKFTKNRDIYFWLLIIGGVLLVLTSIYVIFYRMTTA